MTTTTKNLLGIEIGSVLKDRYEIRELLGQGGFAAVFRAFDNQIERDVAIKILNIASLVSQGNELELMLIRFQREAKLSAQITHPSVVQIFDFGILDEDQKPYIIMEMLEGHDLDRELKNSGPMAPERIIPLFVDTLEALGEAHQRGIVHKDLKPANLFVASAGTRRERLKIVDFGIAHIGDDNEDARLTKTGYMLGTTKYMAPEYVEEQRVSPPLDVYQMGLILVEALSGKPVVDHESFWQCAMMHVGRQLEVPVELLESPLGPVLEKSLAYDPEQRYATATAFADALAEVPVDQVPQLSAESELRGLASNSSEILPKQPASRQILQEALSARESLDQAAEDAPTILEEAPSSLLTDEAEEHDPENEATQAPGRRHLPTAPVTPAPEDSSPSDAKPALRASRGEEEASMTALHAALSSLGNDRKEKRRNLVILLLVFLLLGGTAGFFMLSGDEEEPVDEFAQAIEEHRSGAQQEPDEATAAPTEEEQEQPEATPEEEATAAVNEALEAAEEIPSEEDPEDVEEEPEQEAEEEPVAQPEPRPQPRPRPQPQPQPQPEPDPDPEPDPGFMIAP